MKVAIIDPSGFTLPYDYCLCTALSHHRCEVLFITSKLRPGPWTQCIDYDRREEFYRIASRISEPRIRKYLKGLEHPFDMARLLNLLQRLEPDMIHFQWLPLPLIDGFFLQRLRKIAPLVLTVHDTEPFNGAPSSRLQLIKLATAYKCFSHYIVHTYQSKDVLVRQLLLSEDSVSVIPHGVFSYYQKLHRNTEVSYSLHGRVFTGKKRILFFGVLKPYKGIEILLEAFAHLPQSVIKDTILQIVGHPSMAIEPLKTRAQHLGIANRIHWDLRFVEEMEVANYFAQADVIVLPYQRIDQSGVLNVALPFGKPIIASRVGGFVETIADGTHGFLVEPGDVDSLSRALACILLDGELRRRMGENVKKLSNGSLSWEAIASKTLRVYTDLKRRW